MTQPSSTPGSRTSAGIGRVLTALIAAAVVTATVATERAPAWHPAPRELSPSTALPVAVFGSDDREPIPTKYKHIQEKIGLFLNPRQRTVCTAFCVAPDVIATAGHCLLGTGGLWPARFADFWFARNFDTVREQARIAGYANGTAAQHVTTGSTSISIRPPIDTTRDWALVRLARAVCSKGTLPVRVLPMEQILIEATAHRIFAIAYHRDFKPWKPAYSRSCEVARSFESVGRPQIERDFFEAEALILHTCDTGEASSGSPILLDTPDGPEVIGINVGTYQRMKVLKEDGQVKKRLKSNSIANTAVASVAFAGRLEAFRQAMILATPQEMRELQGLLAQRQLYSGPLDGNYAAELKNAIEAYEKAEGLIVTGLATAALLQRLGGGVTIERGNELKSRTRRGKT